MIRESRIRIVVRPGGRVDVVSRRGIERVPAGNGNRRPVRFLCIGVSAFAEVSRVRRGVDGVVRCRGGGGGRGVPGSARTRWFLRRLGSLFPRAPLMSGAWVCLERFGAVARGALSSSLVVSEAARARPAAAGRKMFVSQLAAEADAHLARFALAASASGSRAIAAAALVAAVVCALRPSSVCVPAAAWSESCRDDGVRRRGVRHIVAEDRFRVGQGGSTSSGWASRARRLRWEAPRRGPRPRSSRPVPVAHGAPSRDARRVPPRAARRVVTHSFVESELDGAGPHSRPEPIDVDLNFARA